MKARVLTCAVFSLAIAAAVFAQDSNPPGNGAPAGSQDNGGNNPRRGGRGYGMGMGMGMAGGRGVMGTVTEVAADHYAIKTDAGETYTIHFSANTRIVKQQAGGRGMGMGPGGGQDANGGAGYGMGRGGGNPPQPIKPTDIKVGDAVGAMGEMDAEKSIGAVMIVQLDPERARQMEQMRANYGRTWIQGRVTAIDGVKVTLAGLVDNAPHSFVADENTVFRKRRDPITLADIQVGDMVRAEGTLKDGAFLATTVNVMGMPAGAGAAPAPPPPPPQ